MINAVEETLQSCLDQYRGMIRQMRRHTGKQPRTIENGSLRTEDSRSWTSGFYPASLWLLYEYSGDKTFRREALRRSRPLKQQRHNRNTHDLGFILHTPLGRALRIEGKAKHARILMDGAESLCSRFNPTVGAIRSWDFGSWSYPVIIDNMMNLEYLFWASDFSGDAVYRDIAVSHADLTMGNHYREDFSCCHVVDYNPVTGEVVSKGTHQGYADSSSWARGQAWGLYGFTMMYRHTGDRRYLDFARNIASFILDHPRLPEDGIPYWDFDDPDIPDTYRDASAAAIIASALVELNGFYDGPQSRGYMASADRMLASLSSPAYLAAPGENHHFLLRHSVGNKPKMSMVDVPLNYTDYYFLEALNRRLDVPGG